MHKGRFNRPAAEIAHRYWDKSRRLNATQSGCAIV